MPSVNTPRTWPRPSASRVSSRRKDPTPASRVRRVDITGAARPGEAGGGDPFIWPGLFLLGEGARAEGEDGLPAASMSSGVGGMGVYWAGSCPRPNASERIPFIPDDEFEALYTRRRAASPGEQEPAGRRRAARPCCATPSPPSSTPTVPKSRRWVSCRPRYRGPAAGCARRAPRRSSVRSRRDRPRSSSDPTPSSVGSCSTTAPRSAPSCWTACSRRGVRSAGTSRRGVR